MTQDVWGPWIEHDGRSYPDLIGYQVEVKVRRPADFPVVDPKDIERPTDRAWLWAILPSDYEVVSYRILRPRGFTILQDIAESPEIERVGA